MADLHINNKGWNYKWTQEEDDIIKKYYPTNGALKIKDMLNGREVGSIQQRAFKLGIKYLSYNENYFNVIDTAEKAYWLGFLYADGYVTKGNRWGVELCHSDYQHLKNLLDCIDYNGEPKLRDRNGIKSYSFQINNKHMTSSLLENGVLHNKTLVLQYPDISVLEEGLYSHFIRGFFDGDGCVSFSTVTQPRKDRNNKIYTRIRKEVNFVCKSYDFIFKLLSVLNQNGIHFNYTINHRDQLHTIKSSSLNEIIKFFDFIYKDSTPKIRLERKYNKFNEIFIATTNSDVSKKIS